MVLTSWTLRPHIPSITHKHFKKVSNPTSMSQYSTSKKSNNYHKSLTSTFNNQPVSRTDSFNSVQAWQQSYQISSLCSAERNKGGDALRTVVSIIMVSASSQGRSNDLLYSEIKLEFTSSLISVLGFFAGLSF